MSSNFEWQQHQVNERVKGALKEGTSHRLARPQAQRGSKSIRLKLALAMGAAVFLLSQVLAGCTPVNPVLAGEAESPAAWTMAERIQFQDRLWENAYTEERAEYAAIWTMAERIRFQDRLWENAYSETAVENKPAWTMEERILFQDRLDQPPK